MSGSESARPATERAPGGLRLTIALWLALLATIPPLLRVVEGGPWVVLAALVCALLLGTGYAMRRLRLPAVAVTLAELVLWLFAVTVLFFPNAALFGFVPTTGVVDAAIAAVRTASDEISAGIAPIEATGALVFVVVAALGLLTIALDHIVLTARLPLLGSVALVIVWLIPAIAVPTSAAEVDVIAFVLLAASVLYLLRADSRTREPRAAGDRQHGRSGGVAAMALAIGAVAILGALVVGPTLPPPTVATVGSGVSARIDPSLDLGNDLRRGEDVTVLTMRSDATQLPNLRVATLSVFDGDVWKPDRMTSVALADDALDPVTVSDGIRVTESRTHVDVQDLASPYLPIPYPAVQVDGLQGDWRSVPYSRTIIAASGSAQGQAYDVVAHVPRPTLEQIRAANARLDDDDLGADLYALPDDTPAIVGNLARELTTDENTDYDKLLALQNWFRGSEFTYSLTAPVEDGFDDAGVQAVAEFLQKKEGYCIHFAGAFALMARELGMPTRIVVGFLPGAYTGDSVDGERVAAVTTEQLHAWPEVYFQGIGWVPFEPTKGLGTATRFASAATPVDDSERDVTTATPAPTSTGSATSAPMDVPEDRVDQATGATSTAADLRPALALLTAALVICAVPGVVAALRRALLRRRGTVGAAWRLVQDTAIDLGASVPAAESARIFGARLVALHDAPPPEMSRLVAAVERANYARATGSSADPGRAAQAMTDAVAIRRAMLTAVPASERVRIALVPRSLVVRPSSAFADRDRDAIA